MGVRETASVLVGAGRRAADPTGAVRWLVRAFLEYRFLDDRGAQTSVALEITDRARSGLDTPGRFQAAVIDGLVTSYADEERGTFRLMTATALFEDGDVASDLLCTELYGEATLQTGECVAARDVVDMVLVGGGGFPADRHRLYVLLARIELVLARPVPAASALHTASRLTAFVDEERVIAVEERLASLVDAPAGPGLTGEELDVAAALAHSTSIAAAAAELSWSLRDVEFYRATARAKLDTTGRHRRQRRAG